MNDASMIEALNKARDAVRGNYSNGSFALARLLGKITGQAVAQWKICPVQRVLDVERVTGIPRHDLRPDIYPPPAVALPHQNQHSGFVSP